MEHAARLALAETPEGGVAAPKGFVIHGPSGVGKTSLALALVHALKINVILVTATEIRSKVVGNAEKEIERMFQQAADCGPCILMIDQVGW